MTALDDATKIRAAMLAAVDGHLDDALASAEIATHPAAEQERVVVGRACGVATPSIATMELVARGLRAQIATAARDPFDLFNGR